MVKFERNQLSLIEKKIDEDVKHPKIGIVTQVYEHSAEDDDSNWDVDVEVDAGTLEEQKCPMLSANSGSIIAPKVGDKVLVLYTEGVDTKPVAMGITWSSEDRPPVGKAGMFRDEYASDTSPAGDGNLYVTGYTDYDDPVSSNDKRDVQPEETFVQIAKHAADENVDPSTAGDIPAKIEMYDSPAKDESWITVEINKRDGGNADATWGMKFSIKTGEVQLVDPSGYGFTSDGDGNWEWYYDSKNETQVSGGGPLSL